MSKTNKPAVLPGQITVEEITGEQENEKGQ